jgi:hypothetical protein
LERSTFGGLTLTHPVSWRVVAPEAMAAGPGSTIGFLTDQPTIAQCSYGPNTMTCGLPVLTIRPNGILVSVQTIFYGSARVSSNATVAGHPAHTVTEPLPQACPAGTRYGSETTIALGRNRGSLAVIACLASTDAPVIATIKRMLDTATYAAPG